MTQVLGATIEVETEILGEVESVAELRTDPGTPDDGDAEATNTDADSVNDVVVDLFARLRATNPDNASELDAVDAATIEAGADTVPDNALVEAEIATEAADEATPFDQRAADLTPLIVASARKLKRVLADEQNEVLDALRRNDPVCDLDALLPWSTHHAERYATVLGDELEAAANAGAALTADGQKPTLGKAAARQAVQQANETLARALVAPLRDRLERCIAEGDGDNPAITKKVRAVYRECKTQHIDDQLDDVFRTAHGRGVLASAELGTPLNWTPDPGDDVCPDCDDNRLAGAVPAGQAFPTGHVCTPGTSRLPLHVGRRGAVISAPMRRSQDLPVDAPRRRFGGRGILIALGGLFLFVLIFGRAIARFYVDYLWHDALGRNDVFWGALGAKVTLFFGFFLIFAVVAGINLLVADRMAPESFPANVHPYVERFHEIFGRRLRLLRYGVALIFALLLATPGHRPVAGVAAVPELAEFRNLRRAVRSRRRFLRFRAAVPDVLARLDVCSSHRRAAVDDRSTYS